MSSNSLVKNNETFTLSKQEKIYDMLLKVGKGDNEKPANTVNNFELVMENDENIVKHIKYNLFSSKDEYIPFDKNGNQLEPKSWQDENDSYFISYIEKNYLLSDDKKFNHALTNVMQNHTYNPVKDLLEYKKWDGVPRIDNFLKDILKCDQNETYLREVSRMIFYGGISRVYEPGCKFDYMIVLSGKQGIGKSTIIKWLALNEKFYREVTTIEGKEGAECIEGGWICEFAELMAMNGSKNLESMKAFVTRQVDKYRKAYGRHVSEIPRTCIFIGTTNETDYLKDNSGNRRYLPLYVGLTRGEMFDNEQYIKDYIINCWREALYLYKNGKSYLTIPNEYYDILEKERNNATVEDLTFNNIRDYLKDKPVNYRVCAKEICLNVLKILEKDLNNRFYSKIISGYMERFTNWERKPSTDLPEYGNQRYWLKVEEDKIEEGDEENEI